MCIGIGQQPCLQHLVRRGAEAGRQVAGFKRSLFDLGEIVLRVAVEFQLADLDERIVAVWPDLGQIERMNVVCLSVQYLRTKY